MYEYNTTANNAQPTTNRIRHLTGATDKSTDWSGWTDGQARLTDGTGQTK